MTPEQIAELVKRLWAKVDEIDDGGPFYSKSAIYRDAANAIVAQQKLIESLQASVANAEARYDASEARNEFLTGVIEAIEQAAKEAKELPK